MRVARFWEKSRDTVTCLVCERRCRIPEGGRGVCGNYVNIGGTLYHYDYGRLSAVESDPLPASPGGSKASPERFVGFPLGSALLIPPIGFPILGASPIRAGGPRPRWDHRTSFPHRAARILILLTEP